MIEKKKITVLYSEGGEEMEDHQIIQLYFERNEQAITETDHKYSGYCLSIANQILNNHEESEECFNDTLLKTWNTIPPVRPQYLKLYLAKIIRNCSFDYFRKRHAKKRAGYEIPLVLDELAECIGDKNTTELQFHENQVKEQINLFLHSLPQKKEIFLFEGISMLTVLLILLIVTKSKKVISMLCYQEHVNS